MVGIQRATELAIDGSGGRQECFAGLVSGFSSFACLYGETTVITIANRLKLNSSWSLDM